MKQYFEVKIRVERAGNNGKIKFYNEVFLVDAMSFTEAEAIITKEESGQLSFEILAIKKFKCSEVINNVDTSIEEEYLVWCKLKIGYITLNEKSGDMKYTYFTSLVHSTSIETATERYKEFCKGVLADYFISGIKETNIIKIY